MKKKLMHCLLLSLLGLTNAILFCAQIDQNTALPDVEKILMQEFNEIGSISLSRLMSFIDLISLPQEVRNIFNSIKIVQPVLIATGADFQLSGQAEINNVPIQIDFKIDKHSKTPKILFEMMLPKGVKPSDISSIFEKLDIMNFESSGFIVSNYKYYDKQWKINVEPGLTFKAGISFDTLLEKFRQKIGSFISADQFKRSILNSVVTDSLAIVISGNIPRNLIDITLTMELPLQFGINIEALRKNDGSPFFKKPLINKIVLSRMFVELGLKKGEPEITFALGISVFPASQTQPIEIQARGKFTQSGIEVAGIILGALDPAFGFDWLALGTFNPKLPPLSLALWFDYGIASSTMAACGVPLPAGFTLSGALGLGKSAHRTVGSGAIKINIETAGLSEFIFVGTIDQIHLTQLIQLLADIAHKKEAVQDVPVIDFKNLKLIISPFGGSIFGVKFDAIVQAEADVQVGFFHAGGVFGLGLTPDEPRFLLEASVDPIQVTLPKCPICPEGGLLFAIGGPHIGQQDRASLKIDFGSSRPLEKQIFKIGGSLQVPPLFYTGALDLKLEKEVFKGTGQGSFLNNKFSATTSVSFNTKDPKDFEFSYQLNSDVMPYVCEQLKKGFAQFKEKAEADIIRYQHDIQSAQNNFGQLSKAEIDRVENHIYDLEEQLKEYNLEKAPHLKTVIPGGSVLQISNHTRMRLFCAMYIVDKKTKESKRAGSILELSPQTKDQMSRPSLFQLLKKDRDMFISTNKESLKNTLTKDDYYAMTRKHVGSMYAHFHIVVEDDRITVYSGPEWKGEVGYDELKLLVELTSYKAYKNALLSPGIKTITKAIDALQTLMVIPQAFIKIADNMLSVLDKGLQFYVFHEAGITVAGKDLLKGKLPQLTLHFDVNLPKLNKITVNVQDLQLDLKNPMPFVLDMAGIISAQILPQFLSSQDKQHILEQVGADQDIKDLKEALTDIDL